MNTHELNRIGLQEMSTDDQIEIQGGGLLGDLWDGFKAFLNIGGGIVTVVGGVWAFVSVFRN